MPDAFTSRQPYTIAADARRVVVVTGASSGIGAAAALALAGPGALLVLAARDAVALEVTVQLIEEAGGRAHLCPTDVTNWEDVRRLAQTALDAFGRIDIWVDCAGIAPQILFEDMPLEEVEQVLRVNVLGPIHAARAVLPVFRSQKHGRLIVVGSLAAVRGVPYRAAYSASKHAVKGFVEALRLEVASDAPDVTITLVHPGAVATARLPSGGRGPLRKLGNALYSPRAVAAAIVFAVDHPRRDIYIGPGRALAAIEGLAPSLLDSAYAAASRRIPERLRSVPADPAAPLDDLAVLPEGRSSSLVTRTVEYWPRRTAAAIAASMLLGVAVLLRRIDRRR
jgi:short-subunit dehydrogenase